MKAQNFRKLTSLVVLMVVVYCQTLTAAQEMPSLPTFTTDHKFSLSTTHELKPRMSSFENFGIEFSLNLISAIPERYWKVVREEVRVGGRVRYIAFEEFFSCEVHEALVSGGEWKMKKAACRPLSAWQPLSPVFRLQPFVLNDEKLSEKLYKALESPSLQFETYDEVLQIKTVRTKKVLEFKDREDLPQSILVCSMLFPDEQLTEEERETLLKETQLASFNCQLQKLQVDNVGTE